MTLSLALIHTPHPSFSFSSQIHISLYWLLPQFAITRALLFDQCKGGREKGTMQAVEKWVKTDKDRREEQEKIMQKEEHCNYKSL